MYVCMYVCMYVMYIALSALYMCTSVTIVCTCKKYSLTTFNLLPTGLVTIPILGADFLRLFGLVVDMGNHSLSDSKTHLEVKGRMVNQPALCLTLLPPLSTPFEALLKDYPAVLQTSPQQPVKHTVAHYIQTTGHPTHSATRRLSPTKLQIVKMNLNTLQLGIIRPSSSSWFSP